ncbi:fimbrial protein [Klebsiella pneumoniae]|uniref:fimbrial protein n=1 Tax=Klebsiella pneumoniae TaxID=573 RepID=UPI0034CEA6EB
MKSKILILSLFFISNFTFGYTCKGQFGSIGWDGGSASVYVTVQSNLTTGKNTIVNLSQQITCKNDSVDQNWVDYMWIDTNGIKLNQSIFSGLNSGVTVSGTDYRTPIPKIQVFNNLKAQQSRTIPVTLFFELSTLNKPFRIKAGDYLGKINFIQGNSGDLSYKQGYVWNFYSANDVNITTSTCDVLSGDPINVSFGNIERSELRASGISRYTITKPLNIKCNGSDTMDLDVVLKPSSIASWNKNAILTNKKNLGVVTRWNGDIMNFNSKKTLKMTKGSATASLSFTPVLPDTATYDQVPTGSFKASASLVVSHQ